MVFAIAILYFYGPTLRPLLLPSQKGDLMMVRESKAN